MAWTNSKIFRQALADMVGNTTPMDFDTDTWKIALYGNGITPDQNVAAASSAYNTGQWVTGGELSDSGQWAAGGVALANKTIDVATSGVVMLDADDTASGSAATLTAVYGGLVYDDTLTTPVADQGLAYLYFGGTNSVTSGTFTVVYSASGLVRWTM